MRLIYLYYYCKQVVGAISLNELYHNTYVIRSKKQKSDNNYSDGILVTNCDTGEIVFFGTQNEASEEFGLSKITLNKLARYEKVRNNLQYKLFRLKEGI